MRDSSRFRPTSTGWGRGLVLVAALFAATMRTAAAPPHVLIFAAASLETALDALAAPSEHVTGVHVTTSYAASSALAQQIENGAPADLFISADLDWMNELASRGLIRVDSRLTLLGNQLVLIAPAKSHATLKIRPEFPLAAALGAGRLALADPTAVPAGKYAKAALTTLGVWASVADRIASAEDVRGALRFVARGEAPLGIVYRTDAIADPGVVVVDTFPETSHPAIVYPIAITARTTDLESARKVLAYLRSSSARDVFVRQGFTFLGRD